MTIGVKKYFLIILSFFASTIGVSQTLTVLSAPHNHTIPGAHIIVFFHNDTLHFTTDNDGKWKVAKQLINQPIDIAVHALGYQDETRKKLEITKDFTIELQSNAQQFDEVAVTAQYKTQLVKNAVHNIKIIDRQQLEAMQAQNVKEALQNELNVHLSTDNILGTGIEIQGIGGENVKILIDGVPLTGRLNGNIDLSQIPIDNIARIEVVEGPLSVSYGTDALAGTINIITKKSQAQKFTASSTNYFESSGKMNNDLNLGWRFGKHQIRVNGGRQFFDGWDPSQSTFYFKQPVADSTRVQLWNPKIQWFAGASYRFKGEHSLFDYSGRFMDERIVNRGEPRPPFLQTAFDDYYKTIRIGQRANFQYFFKNNYRMSITAGYSGYLRNKVTKLRDLTTIHDELSTNPSDLDTSHYHSIIGRGRFIQASPTKKINFEVGFDLTYELATGKKITSTHQTIGDYALYATAEYSPFKALTIRPGLRYGYNTNYAAPITPSLNLKYAIFDKENKNLTLRASYARGFRSPSIKELFFTFVDANHDIIGNKNLAAETSNNFNLSLHFNTEFGKLGWRNKLSMFYNDINNQISLAQINLNEYSYFNLNRYTTTGFQYETSVQFKGLNAGVGIGYVGRYNKIKEGEDFAVDEFLFSPNVNLNLQFNWSKPGLLFAFYYKYSGVLPQVVSDENGVYSLEKLGDYHLADMKISKYIWGKRLIISIGVKNIFDVQTVQGSEGDVISAHSSGNSGNGVSVGIGRTYTFGIKLMIKSK